MAMNMDAVLRIVAKVQGKEQLTGLQGALVGVENTAAKARKAFTDVTSSATWQGAAVAAAGLSVALVASARTAMDFEKAMSGVQAKIGATGGEMSQLTNLAKDLGRTTQFSASQAAEGMDFLAMAGFKTNDVVKAMPGLLDLAAAGNLELGRAADITSNVLGGFGLKAEEASRVADVLAKAATSSNVSVEMLGETFKVVAPVAATAGASLEEMAAAAGLLGDAGIQASEAGTGLRSVMLRLAAPPTEAAKALAQLGVSTKDASGNFRGMGPVLADVDRAMKEMNLGTAEQLEIQNALYGKVAIASGAILQQAAASGTLAEKTKELENAQGSAAKMAETMNDNLAGAFKRLQSAVEGFQIQLMESSNTELKGFIDLLARAINTVTELSKQFPLLTSAVVALTVAFVALVALAPFIAATISVIKSLAALKLGATIAGWAPVIVGAFKGILVWLTGTFLPAILTFFSGPVGWTVLAVVAVVAMAIAFRKPIMEFLGWLGSALSEGFKAAWELVKGPVMAYWEWWKGTATWALKALMAIAYQIWVRPWVELWNKVLREPVTAAATWLQATWTKVTEFLPKAMGKARDAVVAIWTGVINAVKSVINSVMRIIQNGINAGIRAVNFLIRSLNKVSPIQISTIGEVGLPQFARGGYVTRPTIAQIAEGGQPEYVVPVSKAMSFASNIQRGITGDAAIQRSAPAVPPVRIAASGGGSMMSSSPKASPAADPGPVNIQIQTGPIMEFNGQKFVSYDDLERAMRTTADGVMSRLRTPSARLALGTR